MKAELESVTAGEQMRTEQATTGVHSKGDRLEKALDRPH